MQRDFCLGALAASTPWLGRGGVAVGSVWWQRAVPAAWFGGGVVRRSGGREDRSAVGARLLRAGIVARIINVSR